jgi:SAM-dependent methyltransferase
MVATVDLRPVRDAYSTRAAEYISLFDGEWKPDSDDEAFIRHHLAALAGPVLDLGCGPGYWTAYLHHLGVSATGFDICPEFVAHARASHPGPTFQLGSMSELDVPQRSSAGVLSWYSTIHVPPADLHGVLTELREVLRHAGTLVVGFFDSDDGVTEFEHAIVTAYRWPIEEFAQHLAGAGFTVVDRLQRRSPERPDRRYAAIAARAE